MNKDTWISWITTGIGLLGSAAATQGLISSHMATTIAGAAVTLVPLAWGFFIHADSRVVQTAAALPGVQVQVSSAAEPAIKNLAKDPNVKDVVEAEHPVEYPPGIYGTARRRE